MPYITDKIYGYKPYKITKDWGLHDVENGNSYFPCNTCYCLDCNFLFSNTRFDAQEMFSLYKNYRSDSDILIRQSYEPNFVKKLPEIYTNKIEDFLSPLLYNIDHILDWGGNDGSHTPFKDKAYRAFIFDINSNPLVFGEKIVEMDLYNYYYDLIVCSNVMEHLSYPYEELVKINRICHNDAILYLEVPYEKIMKENTKQKYHWHEHINFFNESSLNALLIRSGFSIVKQEIVNNVFNGGSSNSFFMIACRRNHAV